MHSRVAVSAQGDQILFYIGSRMTSELDVMFVALHWGCWVRNDCKQQTGDLAKDIAPPLPLPLNGLDRIARC